MELRDELPSMNQVSPGCDRGAIVDFGVLWVRGLSDSRQEWVRVVALGRSTAGLRGGQESREMSGFPRKVM